nr:unnamed protein product [Callosobruchus chinensis]
MIKRRLGKAETR